MKKWISLLFVIGIIVFIYFLFIHRPEQILPVIKESVTKEETIEALKNILQEYGFANNKENRKVEIDECCITIEYESDGRKYRIVCPTMDVDRMEVERTGSIYMLCYHSDIASFTDLTDDDGYLANEVPFMYVSAPFSKEEIVKMIQCLGDACIQAHTRYYVIHGWSGLDYKISKHFISKVICVYCPTDPGKDIEEQYTNWHRSTYGDRFYNHMVETGFSAYEAESHEMAVKYRNDLLDELRKQKEPFEELNDDEFNYSCNGTKQVLKKNKYHILDLFI